MSSPESRILDRIPADVFKCKQLFHEVLKEAWNQIGEDKKKELKGKCLLATDVLPVEAQDETIDLLLDGDLGRFNHDPVDSIYFNLKLSKCAPDIKQALKEVKSLQFKAQQLKEKEYQMKTWTEIANRRKSIFKSSLNSACDEPITSVECPIREWNPDCSLILNKRESKRVRRTVNGRYINELHKLTNETDVNFVDSSDDENMVQEVKSRTPVEGNDRRIARMMAVYKRKRKITDKEGVPITTLQDIIERMEGRTVDEVNLDPIPMIAAIKAKVRRKSKPSPVVNKLPSPTISVPFKATTSTVNKLTEKLKDSMGAAIFARKMELNLNKKTETADVFDFDDDSPMEPLSKEKTPSSSSTSIANQVSQIISSLAASSCPVSDLPPVPSPCVQATATTPIVYDDPPPSFFSLIRDVFQEHAPSDKKLTLHKLEELVKEKLKNIDPKLGWSHESVQSAMNFLSYYSEVIKLNY